MDDDQVLDCHASLVRALQTRAQLRSLEPLEKPACIGGAKPNDWAGPSASDAPIWHRLSGLQVEFLQSSLAMQMRIRPQLERMQEIRTSCIYNQQWRTVQTELRHTFKTRIDRDARARRPMMLFQLEQAVNSIPGWLEVQREVRETEPHKHLDPVEYDGFYVIKSISRDPEKFSVV